jgi:hypothetical protein
MLENGGAASTSSAAARSWDQHHILAGAGVVSTHSSGRLLAPNAGVAQGKRLGFIPLDGHDTTPFSVALDAVQYICTSLATNGGASISPCASILLLMAGICHRFPAIVDLRCAAPLGVGDKLHGMEWGMAIGTVPLLWSRHPSDIG